MTAPADQNRPGRPAFQGGVCSNPRCPCARPGLPCEEFLGHVETRGWCPRCGWNEAAHGWPEAPADGANVRLADAPNDRRTA